MTDSTANPFGGGIRRGPTAADHFTIVSNEIARGPHLRFFDKGLLVNLLSHKAGFQITEGLLASQSGDGVKAIRDGLNRLRVAGYVYRHPEPVRHPPGTRNAKGKLIGGAVAGYVWSVTDQPDVIAEILKQHAKELAEVAAAVELDLVPPPTDLDAPPDPVDNPELDPVDNPGTDTPADPVDNQNLGAETAASADLQEQGVIPGGDLRPKPTGGIGRAIEDHHQKTNDQENQGPGYAADAFGAPDALRLSGPETSAATGQGGPAPMDQLPGDHLNARAENVVRDLRALDELVGSRKWAPPVPPAPVARRQPRPGPRRRTRRDDLDSATRDRLRAELAQRGAAPLRAVDAHPDGPRFDDGQAAGQRG